MLVQQRYGNRNDFLTKNNPTAQVAVGRMGDNAHFTGSPSLVVLRKTYGDNLPTMWLLPQILDLVAYSNSKSTLDENQAYFLAEAIAQEYYFLTVDEILLFFYRFKLGKYCQFYGTIDPMRITKALDEFCEERVTAIAEHEKREEQRRREEEEKKAEKIDCEEYCRRHGHPIMHNVHEIIRYEMGLEAAKVNSPSH